MNRKEKILSLCLTISIFLLIFSSIYTIIKNKAPNQTFFIEKALKF